MFSRAGADPRAGIGARQRDDLRRLLRLRPGLPLRRPSRNRRSATARGNLVKRTARVNPGLCMGCGTCVAVCPSKNADLDGFSEQQIYAMVESLV